MVKKKFKHGPQLVVLIVLLVVAAALTFTGLGGYVTNSKNLPSTDTLDPTIYISPTQTGLSSAVEGTENIVDNNLANVALLLHTTPNFWCDSSRTPDGRCRFQGERAIAIEGNGNADIYYRGWVNTRNPFKRLDTSQTESNPSAQKIQVVHSASGTYGPGGIGQPSKFHIFARLRCADEPASAPFTRVYIGECTVRDGDLRKTCTKPLGVGCKNQFAVQEVMLARADLPSYIMAPAIHEVKLVREYTCYDGDFHQDSTAKATTTLTKPNGEAIQSEDRCLDANRVEEHYCSALTGSNENIKKSTTISCPSETTCQDGKCAPQVPPASESIKYPVSIHSRNTSGNSILDSTSLAISKMLEYVTLDGRQELPLGCPIGFSTVAGGCKSPNSLFRTIRGWMIFDFTANEIAFTARKIKLVTAGLPFGCNQCSLVSKVEVFTTPSLSNPVWTHRGTCSVNLQRLEVCTLDLPLGSLVKGVLLGRKSSPGNAALDPTIVDLWISTQ